MKPARLRPVPIALIALGLSVSSVAGAVRVNSDGLGQALVYPYYTVRSTPGGNAFATLVTVTNVTPRPKALKVRFLEAKAGAEVLEFNLFLGGYDVWTAGIVPTSAGAGLFTRDHSCAMPAIALDPVNPTVLRNGAYAGDSLGDDPDRTREGYFEVLEMGVIDPDSALGAAVASLPDYSGPNASRPTCNDLPSTDAVPPGLSAPSGGLAGNASYINVNEGTDYSFDAVALSQWSDRVQWSIPGSAHPTLADASPAVSYMVESTDAADKAYLTHWARGHDAVSAVLMVDEVTNDYTVESGIRAATDWILTMPTKRFYITATSSEAPFAGGGGPLGAPNKSYCELRIRCDPGSEIYFDREGQSPGAPICFSGVNNGLCGAAANLTFTANLGYALTSHVLQSKSPNNATLNAGWVNGLLPYPVKSIGPNGEYASTRTRGLAAPAGSTTIIDTRSGATRQGATVTYFGLPIVGFAAQSYTNGTLQGAGGSVLSNYGGTFAHKYRRRVSIAP